MQSVSRLFGEVKRNNMRKSSVSQLGKLLHSKDLQEILNAGRTILGNPLMLTDLTHKLLAITHEPDIQDPHWAEIESQGGIPIALSRHPSVSAQYAISAEEDSIVTDTISIGQTGPSMTMLRKTLCIRGKVIGFLESPGYNGSFSEDNVAVFGVIGDLCALQMERRMNYGDSPENQFEFFISDLMTGRITDVNLIEERMHFFGWKLSPSLRILTACFNPDDKTMHAPDIQTIYQTVQEEFPFLIAFVHGYDIKILLPYEKPFAEEEVMTASLTQLLIQKGLYAGISKVFSDIQSFADSNMQAEKALEIGYLIHPGNQIYFYDEYSVFHLIEISRPYINPEQFCHSSIMQLMEYDKTRSGEFMNTLKSYLTHNKSIVDTATYLNIHRNTVSYRINRIQELFDINLDDVQTTFDVLLSFNILDN
jgi:hypothetical protein